MAKHLTKTEIKYLNLQYLPRLTVANADKYLNISTSKSARVRDKLDCILNIPYGTGTLQKLDIFPSKEKKGPVHIFIHGGYWRATEIDKNVYSHIAGPMVEAGATVVLVDYDLCPNVRITDIYAQIQEAVIWVYKNIAQYNGNSSKIFLSGHSAGGHLVGLMLMTDWKGKDTFLPVNLISGATSLSGIFDITPHRHTSIQSDIKLSSTEARAMSPMFLKPIAKNSVILAVGQNEPDLFHWQSLQFAAHLRLNNVSAEYVATLNDNHFPITNRLASKQDPLTKRLIQQMGLQ